MTGRRPARRRSGRRRTRKPRGGEGLAVLGAAAAGLWLIVTIANWLLEHWWIPAALAAAAAAATGWWLHQRAQQAKWERVRARALRYALPQLDALHHRQFELAVRDLMRRDGCADAEQVGGAGDNGADVKATDPFGRRWVIQCKHRRAGLAGSPVRTPDLQVLNGTARQVHGADVVILVTNGRFTANCRPFAESQRLHLVDRHLLGEWAAGSRPLWELLHKLPPPRRPSPLS
ncbi:restriction endonuclease [Streptomyces sp. GC420]|uniref:restriction endonuclease n=1 Tax=Streptomyces sp. GC420 TaxID=2697568 RepID=UPI0014151CF2|nr:restriction endonuclease [Streptomyces sp. GC420]NBM17978.1 restriction endonuclease [Streptomyces sp. GC420]